MTKKEALYKNYDIHPVECSLAANQKKFKRVELLFSPSLIFAIG